MRSMSSPQPKGTRERAEPQKARGLPQFIPERCKQCGICTHFCPQSCLDTDEAGYPRLIDPSACNACALCEKLCPDFAVFMRDREPEEGTPEEDPGEES